MELKKFTDKVTDKIKKYRYAALVVLLGLLLMAIPAKHEQKAENNSACQPAPQVTDEQRLSEILSQIEGAGKVKVMLTNAVGEEVVYQTDNQLSNGDTSHTEQRNTVTLTDSERRQFGLVRQVNPPVFLGAVVVCQGADRASVRLNIVDAVSKITGLSADRISVLKMK